MWKLVSVINYLNTFTWYLSGTCSKPNISRKLKRTSNKETAKQQSLTSVYGWTTSILCTLCNNN